MGSVKADAALAALERLAKQQQALADAEEHGPRNYVAVRKNFITLAISTDFRALVEALKEKG